MSLRPKPSGQFRDLPMGLIVPLTHAEYPQCDKFGISNCVDEIHNL